MYLIHWPVITFAKELYYDGIDIDAYGYGMMVVLTITLTILAHHLVENPLTLVSLLKGKGKFDVFVAGNSYLQKYRRWPDKIFRGRYRKYYHMDGDTCVPFFNYTGIHSMGWGCESFTKKIHCDVFDYDCQKLLYDWGRQTSYGLWEESISASIRICGKPSVPWFTIDLDAPAKTRYAQIARVYKDQIPPVLDVLRQMVAMIVGDLPLFEVLESFFRDAFEGGRYPQPYRDEIQGIADASGVPVEQIAMMNVFYELSRYCTSIVAEDATGGMWHGR
ncbi:unnamed protein product, partial [Mesorhabditis spiculigera]